MKGKQLRKAVLLGMAMSMAVWTTGMAETPIGPITESYNENNKVTQGDVRVENGTESASIQIGHENTQDVIVNIKTEANGAENGDILLKSGQYGIRTENESTGTIQLDAAGNNTISFADGSGISAGSGVSIELKATGDNTITYLDDGDHDGINAGANNTGGISLQGANNTIKVLGNDSDGIYTDTGSFNQIDLIAKGGSNTITVGNNGIDHRGDGSVKLQAQDGGEGQAEGALEGDGIRVAGNREVTVTLEAQYNEIFGHDEGIYVAEGANTQIDITATGKAGNNIHGNDNGIEVVGTGIVNVSAGQGVNSITANHYGSYAAGTDSKVTLSAKKNKIVVTGTNGATGISAGDGAVQVIDSDEDSYIEVSATKGDIFGIHADAGGKVITEKGQTIGSLTIHATSDSATRLSGILAGKLNNREGKPALVDLNVIDDVMIDVKTTTNNAAAGITVNSNGQVNLSSQNGNITISSGFIENNESRTGNTYGVSVKDSGELTLVAENGSIYIKSGNQEKPGNTSTGILGESASSKVNLNIEAGELLDIKSYAGNGSSNGISIAKNNNAAITAGSMKITSSSTAKSSGTQSSGISSIGTNTVFEAAIQGDVWIDAEGNAQVYGIRSDGDSGISDAGTEKTSIGSESGNITIGVVSHGGTGYGINTNNSAQTSLTAENGQINISVKNDQSGTVYGLFANANGAANNTKIKGAAISIEASSDSGTAYGIQAQNSGTTVQLEAESQNEIKKAQYGIFSANSAEVKLIAGMDNWIQADDGLLAQALDSSITLTAKNGNNYIDAGLESLDSQFRDGMAIKASSGADVTLVAENGSNILKGAIHSTGGKDKALSGVNIGGAANKIYSAAVIDNAGGLQDDENPDSDASFKDKSVVSALYAEHGAAIKMTGEQNIIRTYADSSQEDTILERAVWAYEGSDITIDGTTTISTDSYELSHNSADIAIAAGTAVNLEDEDFKTPIEDAKRAKVTLNYGADSKIIGDVLSAYAGKVDIAPQETTTRSNSAGISITGNLLAGNNGILNVNLGNGGTLTGRTDDYGDANDTIVNDEHIQFFNPAFSSTIYRGGEVNLTMGNGSYWDVTGQSWLTSLTGDGGVIDMRGSGDSGTTSYAVHIGTITGNHTFVMDLDRDHHNVSDMLYIKDQASSAGEQTVYLNSVAGLENMADGEKLRFATVNAGTDNLWFNGVYEGENSYGAARSRAMLRDVGAKDVAFDIRSEDYAVTAGTENTGYNGERFDKTKPGNDYVDANYDEGTNWFLVRNKEADVVSDAGKTVIAMSRINYSNAVYMDRLNKRMGEARYIDGDEGLWVRMRHDRIGKSDAFRSMNTMLELGYDKRVDDREDGEHRQGVAIDYMRGTADYKNVAGEGDVRRGGIWFYDTWLGNKGHYTDYVLKFGRLSNDFELYARSTGEKITGDYSNFVYSASAEYGRKKDLGNNWYIEPQAQIQYAHVTDADYTTSQDTQVDLDAIDSLIGRVGFRLGKDVGEKSTFYIKADVLHEFLGDQDIEARDATGLLSTTYENEGTWYDIGLGFSHQFSKGTYMFLDVEKTFGNDNEDTYQFNVGMNWKV